MTFADIGLHPTLLNALSTAGYTAPTPVQAQAIPAALEGRDLIVSSQTGSGKTAAFMLPALHSLAEQQRRPFVPLKRRTPNQERQSARARGFERPRFAPAKPRLLVLAPTRELALQVTAATEKYASDIRHLKAAAILGGMPYPKQLERLALNPEILVATPGRLIDHLQSGKIDFSEVQMLVLDEADRMLDMGFIDDIETIVAATPESRQTMLFSATLDGNVGQMSRRVTRDALTIEVASAQARHENIEQRLHYVDDLAHKNRLLDHLLRDAAIDQAIVFTATKREADVLADRLNIAGLNAAALHGDMPQGARNRTLGALRRGHVRILVATDVAARGIDVPTITHVFNYDLPKCAEDYVHRIGRTGRAGRHGIAISLVGHDANFHVRRIERFTQQNIPIEIVEGHEPKRQPPSSRRPGSRPQQNRPWRSEGGPRNGAKTTTDRADRPYPNKSRHGAETGTPYGGNARPAHRPTEERRAPRWQDGKDSAPAHRNANDKNTTRTHDTHNGTDRYKTRKNATFRQR